jgi:integrase/recombinase XerD
MTSDRNSISTFRLPSTPSSIAVAAAFIAHLEAKGCSPNTLRAYAFDLNHFDRFLQRASLRWERLTGGQAVEFLLFLRSTPARFKGHRPGARLSAASVNRILAAIASFYEWAQLAEHFEGRSPFERVQARSTFSARPSSAVSHRYSAAVNDAASAARTGGETTSSSAD